MPMPYRISRKPRRHSQSFALCRSGWRMGCRNCAPAASLKRLGEQKRILCVRAVKIVAAGGLVLSIPFSSLATRTQKDNYAMSYIYFGTAEQQMQNALHLIRHRLQDFGMARHLAIEVPGGNIARPNCRKISWMV